MNRMIPRVLLAAAVMFPVIVVSPAFARQKTRGARWLRS
jgi:hypothetical protein